MVKKLILDNQETVYDISDEGYIINRKTQHPKTVTNGNVQLTVNGKPKGYSLGRLVALNFLGNPDNLDYITHIDGDKNNNRVENLKWISAKENALNTWEKRRENNTTGAGVSRGKRTRENIVGNVTYTLLDNEKQIELDGELIPYAVDTTGKVRNLKRGNYLTGSVLHSYQYINFNWEGHKKNKAVHQLVATAFVPNPNGYKMVDHINGDRLDNRVENLRWVSAKENSQNIHKDKTPKSPEFPEVIYTEEELNNEEWADYEGYKVSNLGRVISKQGKFLKGSNLMSGYIGYSINDKRILGQVLVWEAFNGKKPDNKLVINHINGNKHDNRLSNLELITHRENMLKAAEETNAWNFRRVGEYDDDGNLLRTFPNASSAAREIGILPSSMRTTIRREGKCYNGLTYRYIEI